MSKSQFIHTYDSIISVENLLTAWNEFVKGKKNRKDVQAFQVRLMDNILSLHHELKNKTYRHRGYEAFKISDPKPRNIHKASVRDRLLHRAIYRKLYPFFDRTFISDSFSCRLAKGTHKALKRFTDFHKKVSKNHTKIIWVLKCDIRKFFASVDQEVLMDILVLYIPNREVLWLLRQIICSFPLGLPLGNLTSQLLVNIYMNEFDQFVKHKLKSRYYIRYADDFVILSENRLYQEDILNRVKDFLSDRLKLLLHPNKVSIKSLASGVDYLGWVHFPDHRVLRTSTKRKMLRKVSDKNRASYVGLLKHGNTRRLNDQIGIILPDLTN
jgi:retron-type reverse transcriptase